MITSGGRKSETTIEHKLIVVVCGYPELYDTTLYFYKNKNTFCSKCNGCMPVRAVCKPHSPDLKRGALATDARGCSLWRSLLERPPPAPESRDPLGELVRTRVGGGYTRLEVPGRSPSHDANSCLLCSEFHARMKRISRASEASKLPKCSSVQLRANSAIYSLHSRLV